jgi:transposase-like protein
MTYPDHKTRVAFTPAAIGVLLWASATALLLEDAWHAQRFDVATLSVPILTAATVAAACMAHTRFARFRLVGGLGFAALALLGSLVMATGTLGRLAETKDGKVADVNRTNRTYGFRIADLNAAKAEQARECRTIGDRCKAWNARVDSLTRELAGIVVKSADPKADAIARLASLSGFDADRTKEIVAATDPVLLPLFLELGSVLFFASAFPRRKVATVTAPVTVAEEVDRNSQETLKGCARVWSRDEALQDMLRLKEVGAQRFLAARYGVDKSTISRWMQQWETEGHVHRTRDGQSKAVAMLAAPARTRKTLVFRHKARRLPAS